MLSRMERHRSHLDAMYLYFFRMRFYHHFLVIFEYSVYRSIDLFFINDYDARADLHRQSVLTDRLQKAHNNAVMVLCVLLSHIFTVRLGGARLRALISFCISLSTRPVLPPLFDSNLVRLSFIQKE